MLERTLAQGRVRHAYLLVGPSHIGKTAVARWFAQCLCCSGAPAPCGRCRSCLLIARGVHPDVRSIQPPGERDDTVALALDPVESGGRSAERAISIGHVRALQHDVALSASEAPWKVYLILGAETMQIAAANALLKTLEEPPPHVVLLMTAGDPGEILPTLVSRCQVVRLGLVPARQIGAAVAERGADPSRAELLARLAGGRPGWALRALDDADLLAERERALEELALTVTPGHRQRFSLAEKLATTYGRDHAAVLERLAVWQVWWWDVQLIQRHCADLIANVDRVDELQRFAAAVPAGDVTGYLCDLSTAIGYLLQNVSPRLALENLLLAAPTVSSGH
jgi:DNA polymerase-3 subunit delta'